MPAWITQQIVARAFYARADTWRPMLLGTVVAVAAIPLYLALGNATASSASPCAAAIGMTANALATLRWRAACTARRDLSRLFATTARAAVIAAVAAAAAAVVPRLGTGRTFATAFADLAAGAVLYAVVLTAGVRFFGDAPMRETMAGLLRRLRRRRAR